MLTDLLVVGAGLTGATIARLALDAGISISVVERKSHIGGNLKDWVHPESGERIHGHGPHFFRTSAEPIWRFVNRFSEFDRFEATVSSRVNGSLIPWPLSENWLLQNYGPTIPRFSNPTNFEESCLNRLPEAAYRDMIAPYVAKQWGVDPSTLDAELGRRIEIRPGDGDPRLKTSKWQGLPQQGYDPLIQTMLAGCPITVAIDGTQKRGRKLTVFTGAIDEFFGFSLGRLRYRSMFREHFWAPHDFKHYSTTCLACPQLRDGPHVRDTEWPISSGSLITRETPYSPTDTADLEYPFPSIEDKALHSAYLTLAEKECPDVIFAGRLGRFQYLDMDQAIASAFAIFEKQIKPRLAGLDVPSAA